MFHPEEQPVSIAVSALSPTPRQPLCDFLPLGWVFLENLFKWESRSTCSFGSGRFYLVRCFQGSGMLCQLYPSNE